MQDKKRAAYALIRNVFLVLFVLSLAELAVAIYLESTVLLMLFATGKAVLVVYFFMHIYRLWRQEAH